VVYCGFLVVMFDVRTRRTRSRSPRFPDGLADPDYVKLGGSSGRIMLHRNNRARLPSRPRRIVFHRARSRVLRVFDIATNTAEGGSAFYFPPQPDKVDGADAGRRELCPPQPLIFSCQDGLIYPHHHYDGEGLYIVQLAR